jgi:hypothetical protein
MSRYLLTASMAVMMAACAAPLQPGIPASVAQTIQVDTGREFDLAVGQEARVNGTPLSIRFRSVSEDSRCPSDVQCVWAGNAVVRMTLGSSTGGSSEVSLNSTLEPKSVVFSGYRVRMTGLKPVPRSGNPVPAAEYVVTLEVTTP